MPYSPHGICKVQWCDQVCFVGLQGSFNTEGVHAMLAAIQQAWRDAGQPGHWAHVMDLHLWQGGTESGSLPLDVVGNRRFSGAVNAARGHANHRDGLDPDG